MYWKPGEHSGRLQLPVPADVPLTNRFHERLGDLERDVEPSGGQPVPGEHQGHGGCPGGHVPVQTLIAPGWLASGCRQVHLERRAESGVGAAHQDQGVGGAGAVLRSRVVDLGAQRAAAGQEPAGERGPRAEQRVALVGAEQAPAVALGPGGQPGLLPERRRLVAGQAAALRAELLRRRGDDAVLGLGHLRALVLPGATFCALSGRLAPVMNCGSEQVHSEYRFGSPIFFRRTAFSWFCCSAQRRGTRP